MNTNDAKQLALQLMAEHGCEGWSFRWGKGKRTLGTASYKYQRDPVTGERVQFDHYLTLSKAMVEINDEPAVRDTILHEIAHIKAGLENGHNHVWRAWCIRIGAKPQQYASRETKNIPQHTHELACSCCGHVYKRMYRATRKDWSRAYCHKCGINKSRGAIVCRQVS